MKQQGSGSVWNSGDWHWEQRNYTEEAKKILKEIILQIKLQEGETKFENTTVKSIEGYAEINIRKGKQVFLYELATEVEWTASCKDDIIEGSYKINEITQDMDDLQLESLKTEEKSNFATRVVNLIKKQIINKFVEGLKDFQQKIQQIESDPQKLSQDRQKKEQNAQFTQMVRDQNGDQKEQIFLQQKEKEKKMKEENYHLSQKQKAQEKEQQQQQQIEQQQNSNQQ